MSEVSDPYATAKANLRDTIKWLATSLAAVGAAVIAGASINGLAALQGGSLLFAALLGGAGLGAILVAIAIMMRLLTSKVFYFSDLQRPDDPVALEINSRANDILSPQIPTIADLVAFRQSAVDDLGESQPGDPLYDLAFRKWTAANDLIARVTNLAQFLAFRNEFNRQQGTLFALTIVIILALGSYALLAGTQSDLSSNLAPKIAFNPGLGWSDAAALLAKECGGDSLDGTMIQKKSFDGWVSVRLAQPGRCGGLELTVPASLVRLSGP